MKKPRETIFATKYALTDGITEELAEIHNNGMAVIPEKGCFGTYYHGEGKDWHRTIESAKARAEEMRNRKIASHQKAITKLESLKF